MSSPSSMLVEAKTPTPEHTLLGPTRIFGSSSFTNRAHSRDSRAMSLALTLDPDAWCSAAAEVTAGDASRLSSMVPSRARRFASVSVLDPSTEAASIDNTVTVRNMMSHWPGLCGFPFHPGSPRQGAPPRALLALPEPAPCTFELLHALRPTHPARAYRSGAGSVGIGARG